MKKGLEGVMRQINAGTAFSRSHCPNLRMQVRFQIRSVSG